jgi:hypothetical protein
VLTVLCWCMGLALWWADWVGGGKKERLPGWAMDDRLNRSIDRSRSIESIPHRNPRNHIQRTLPPQHIHTHPHTSNAPRVEGLERLAVQPDDGRLMAQLRHRVDVLRGRRAHRGVGHGSYSSSCWAFGLVWQVKQAKQPARNQRGPAPASFVSLRGEVWWVGGWVSGSANAIAVGMGQCLLLCDSQRQQRARRRVSLID